MIKSISPVEQHNDGWLIENYVRTNNKIRVGDNPEVFEGISTSTQQPVAIKCMSCKDIDMKKFEMILSATPIPFPFILNLQDAFLCKSNEILYLVFNMCTGLLDSCLAKKNPNLKLGATKKIYPENEALKIFFQIVEGCLWLWGNNIIHTNIRPECILYRFDRGIQKNVFIISDFGASTLRPCSFVAGSSVSPYMAPEVILSNEHDYLCDVWSLGLVLHELLFGEAYYNHPNVEGMQKKILGLQYKLSADQKKTISAKTATLLENMIVHDSKHRISKEALKKMVREFAEYEFVREILFKFKHQKRVLNSDQNTRETSIQYAKNLVTNSWEIGLNGYYETSKNMTKEAYQIYLNLIGEDCAETRYAMIRYAQNLMFLNQIEEAKAIGDRALELYKKNKDEKDADFAKAYMIVGCIYYKIGEYKTSKKFLEKAVKMRLDINGKLHRETAAAINNLGATLRNLNDLTGAKESWKKSLSISIKLFGKQHFESSFSYFNLSLVLLDLKNYKKALKFCQIAKKIRQNYFGKNHERTKEAERQETIIKQNIKKKHSKTTISFI